MHERNGSQIIHDWPEESREATQLVIDKYGDPHETTPTTLVWFNAGPWKRIVHEAPDPDTSILSEEDLESAIREGEQGSAAQQGKEA